MPKPPKPPPIPMPATLTLADLRYLANAFEQMTLGLQELIRVYEEPALWPMLQGVLVRAPAFRAPLPPESSARRGRPRGSRNRPKPRPASTAKEVQVRRLRSHALLAAFDTAEPRPVTPAERARALVLVRYGYLRKENGGFVRTDKPYEIEAERARTRSQSRADEAPPRVEAP